MLEGLDLSVVAQDLQSQAAQPLPADAPGASEPEADPPTDSDPPSDDGDGGGDSGDDGETEDDPPPGCGGFECADGTCIDAGWECDGFSDCAAGEDEANCESCSGHTCGDGSCIPAEWVCDEILDCADESDESACGIAQPMGGLDLTGSRGPLAVDGQCFWSSTLAGGAAGAATAEVASKACVGGGILVGVTTAPSGGGAVGGFGAAAICGVADVTQADLVVGGLVGALAGGVGGITYCDGGIVDQVGNLVDWWYGTEPEALPVYNLQSSSAEVPGLGDAALTCSGVPNAELSYKDPSACGDDLFSLTCEPGVATEAQCGEWQDLANRNLLCHWARIIAANTFHGGTSDAGHTTAIRGARNNFEGCKTLIEDNCDESHDPKDEDDAQDDAMSLMCG
ncbi:MAG: LDL receptor domain-containing protein [Myxococcota bacterium]